MVVVVMGMHRSGTSAVANVLHHLGVSMGDRLLPANRWNPHGHYEDVDFFELNVEMLHLAGGDWAHPPAEEAIREAGRWLLPEMIQLVRWKERARRTWGWKDPRMALTIRVWWEALGQAMIQDVRVVRVVREHVAVVESLARRSREAAALAGEMGEEDAGMAELATWEQNRWDALVHEYERRIAQFLGDVQAPCLTVAFEDLVRVETTRTVVELLADYVGVAYDDGAVEAAARQIAVRDGWVDVVDGETGEVTQCRR